MLVRKEGPELWGRQLSAPIPSLAREESKGHSSAASSLIIDAIFLRAYYEPELFETIGMCPPMRERSLPLRSFCSSGMKQATHDKFN